MPVQVIQLSDRGSASLQIRCGLERFTLFESRWTGSVDGEELVIGKRRAGGDRRVPRTEQALGDRDACFSHLMNNPLIGKGQRGVCREHDFEWLAAVDVRFEEVVEFLRLRGQAAR
jgi:hypothetical protein